MSIQLVPLSRLITPSPGHNIRLLSSTQCLSRYTKGCPYKSSTSVLRRWKYHRQRDLVAPPQSSNTEMPERPRLQVLEAVNSSSHVNLRNRRWCQEFHRYGHKVAWGRQKAPRSFGGWWGRREWTMSWSSSSTASLPSPVACSSINTSRSWGWPLDVIATQTRKRHSQFTGLSISLWPTSLFLGSWLFTHVSWYRVDAPYKPITDHGTGKRMGGGKGSIDEYGTPVRLIFGHPFQYLNLPR